MGTTVNMRLRQSHMNRVKLQGRYITVSLFAPSKLLADLDDRQRHSTNGFQVASCAASEHADSPGVLRGNDALASESRSR